MGNMDTEIPKAYDPKAWEDDLYRKWEESGFFRPEKSQGVERYTNILPPPNANGELHLGHASGYTVMDILGRFERMRGKRTLLLPGKDHAGIQTQVVFEKKLHADRGITRHDLGREKFYQETYDFCLDRASYMRSQEKRIGLSADWSRETFTLDPEVSRRATETFVRMYHDGMIYRGERIINWCPRCATALSDVEVIHKETEGKLYHLSYPVKDSDKTITVATTRPETMLGDTAVAVHPDDKRYQPLVGKTIILPLLDREIPIIADERVDRSFGTGAVKITPAHDPLDWEIGKTHHLEAIQVIGTDAKITEAGKQFHGLPIDEARIKVLEALKQSGNFIKEESHSINLSACERCKTAIEPLISKQWFIDVDAKAYSLKRKSIEALRTDAIVFHPENMRDQMTNWLENLHDWCISRQLWWGHRIPIWYREQGTEEVYCGIDAPEGDGWKQDPDTLDTWFSSGQWPYTTLGYPDQEDAKIFYSTDTMVMGRDLLFFWATRMVMFGFYTTREAPFKHLYFTGLVRDEKGAKMSKSKGNGIDVLHAIDRFGADAVRLSLVLGTTPGLDFNLSDEKIETFRNFANKLWNIGRYIENQGTRNKEQGAETLETKTDADRWILGRTEAVAKEVTRLLENHQISLAGETLRAFTWDDFADWYVEVHKIEKNDALLRHAFDTILKLWHPFMPFVTEAIHQTLRLDKSEFLMVAKWPSQSPSGIVAGRPTSETPMNADAFELVKDLIVKIRNIRSVYHIDPTVKMVVSTRDASERTIRDNEEVFKRLARVSEVRTAGADTPEHTLLIQSGLLQAFLHLDGAIDIEKEKARIGKELVETERYVASLEMKLSNPSFTDRAPQALVEQTKVTLDATRAKTEELQAHLSSLG
jgi:valyl-tRNA synthetase